jgi:hypothetical protein
MTGKTRWSKKRLDAKMTEIYSHFKETRIIENKASSYFFTAEDYETMPIFKIKSARDKVKLVTSVRVNRAGRFFPGTFTDVEASNVGTRPAMNFFLTRHRLPEIQRGKILDLGPRQLMTITIDRVRVPLDAVAGRMYPGAFAFRDAMIDGLIKAPVDHGMRWTSYLKSALFNVDKHDRNTKPLIEKFMDIDVEGSFERFMDRDTFVTWDAKIGEKLFEMDEAGITTDEKELSTSRLLKFYEEKISPSLDFDLFDGFKEKSDKESVKKWHRRYLNELDNEEVVEHVIKKNYRKRLRKVSWEHVEDQLLDKTDESDLNSEMHLRILKKWFAMPNSDLKLQCDAMKNLLLDENVKPMKERNKDFWTKARRIYNRKKCLPSLDEIL